MAFDWSILDPQAGGQGNAFYGQLPSLAPPGVVSETPQMAGATSPSAQPPVPGGAPQQQGGVPRLNVLQRLLAGPKFWSDVYGVGEFDENYRRAQERASRQVNLAKSRAALTKRVNEGLGIDRETLARIAINNPQLAKDIESVMPKEEKDPESIRVARWLADPNVPQEQKSALMERARASATSIDIGSKSGRPKLSTDMMWKDPNDPNNYEVQAIPGSPADLKQKKTASVMGNLDQALAGLEEMYKGREGGAGDYASRVMPGTESNKMMSTAYIHTMMQLKELYELGALQGPDMLYMEKALADPTDWKAWSTKSNPKQIRMLRGMLRRSSDPAAQGLPPLDGEMPTIKPGTTFMDEVRDAAGMGNASSVRDIKVPEGWKIEIEE